MLILWLLAMVVLAIVAGLRDQVTFIAVLLIGAALIELRLLLERKEHGLPLAIVFRGTQPGDVEVEQGQTWQTGPFRPVLGSQEVRKSQ